ncbi:MAG: hypothetical protein LLG06_16340 [Desulfobacteraceae bacterium]|nr:hypothetical protein [Desulfobacteraceae bacterium]
MVEAQTRLNTPTLIALMLMAALVGYGIDQVIYYANRRISNWKYVQ